MANTPFTDIARRGGNKSKGLAPWLLGLLVIVGIVVFAYFAYSKSNPFSSPYELRAVFESTNEIRPKSPVRIAGVEVGKVTSIEPLKDGSGMSEIKMEIRD